MEKRAVTNHAVAVKLDEIAELLETQAANPFRISAYRKAAETVRRLPEQVTELVAREGLEGLDRLPGIGTSLARAIFQIVNHGYSPIAERLRGVSDPIDILRSIPGIGRISADYLYNELSIHSLEELEAAAYDGRLEKAPGFGPKKLKGVRESLEARLGRLRRPAGNTVIPISELLAIDREYLDKASRGELELIAPRRFNPKHEAWLPILHATRGDIHYTALFSNTPHAHQMGKTRDWVVIYCDGIAGERQFTAITSERGPLEGRRIIRGREAECLDYYFGNSGRS